MSFWQVRLKYLGSQRYRIDFQVRIQIIQTWPEQSNRIKPGQIQSNVVQSKFVLFNYSKPTPNASESKETQQPTKTIQINQLRDTHQSCNQSKARQKLAVLCHMPKAEESPDLVLFVEYQFSGSRPGSSSSLREVGGGGCSWLAFPTQCGIDCH